jgi:hypothetical protein
MDEFGVCPWRPIPLDRLLALDDQGTRAYCHFYTTHVRGLLVRLRDMGKQDAEFLRCFRLADGCTHLGTELLRESVLARCAVLNAYSSLEFYEAIPDGEIWNGPFVVEVFHHRDDAAREFRARFSQLLHLYSTRAGCAYENGIIEALPWKFRPFGLTFNPMVADGQDTELQEDQEQAELLTLRFTLHDRNLCSELHLRRDLETRHSQGPVAVSGPAG